MLLNKTCAPRFGPTTGSDGPKRRPPCFSPPSAPCYTTLIATAISTSTITMTVPLSPTRPTLSAKTKSKLDALLASSALELPGCFFEVVSAEGTLYSGRAGRVDVLRPLEEEGNQVDEKTVLSFFSTTKLLTSVSRSLGEGRGRNEGASSPSSPVSDLLCFVWWVGVRRSPSSNSSTAVFSRSTPTHLHTSPSSQLPD